MINFKEHVPVKETLSKLAKFPRFSVVEKLTPIIFETVLEAAKKVASNIRMKIQAANKENKPFVLGLASGSTPIETYNQLVRFHRQEGLSFKNVITFQLDEYYPIAKDDELSYNHFLKTKLYDHVDLKQENINRIDGEIEREQLSQFCENYEKKIKECGGIDLQLLGIGRSGHIGFNEPPSGQNSKTRVVYIRRLTRKDASAAFRGIENVPTAAITMGIWTIKKAKEIIVMAWSELKAPIIKKSIEGGVSSENPISFLQDHPNISVYLDKSAGQFLSRFTIPWTIKGDTQDPEVPLTKFWIIKSVVWLSLTVKKPILQLTVEDYENYGLGNLAIECSEGNVENINLFVYRDLR